MSEVHGVGEARTGLVVMKFGGTSLEDAKAMLRTVSIVRSIAYASSSDVPPNFMTTRPVLASPTPCTSLMPTPQLVPQAYSSPSTPRVCPGAPAPQHSAPLPPPRRESYCATAPRTSSPADCTHADAQPSMPSHARASCPAAVADGPRWHRIPQAVPERSAGAAPPAAQIRSMPQALLHASPSSAA